MDFFQAEYIRVEVSIMRALSTGGALALSNVKARGSSDSGNQGRSRKQSRVDHGET